MDRSSMLTENSSNSRSISSSVTILLLAPNYDEVGREALAPTRRGVTKTVTNPEGSARKKCSIGYEINPNFALVALHHSCRKVVAGTVVLLPLLLFLGACFRPKFRRHYVFAAKNLRNLRFNTAC